MPPAAIAAPSNNITGFVLNHHQENPHGATFAAAAAAATALKYQTVAARIMTAQRQRNQDDTDDKTLALFRARRLVALKQQELDMAIIRRLREEEQARKELLSNNHNRESVLMNRNAALMPMAASASASVEDGSSRLDKSSRKRRLEDDILLGGRENILMRTRQQQEEELILLNNLRKEEMLTGSRRNQEDTLLMNSIMRQQNMMLSGAGPSRTTSADTRSLITRYGKDLLSLSSAPSASPTTPQFFADQSSSFAGRQRPSDSSQFNHIELRNETSPSIFGSSSSSSTSGSSMSTSNQDLLSLYNYYNSVNGCGLNGSNNTYAAMPTSNAPLPTSSRIGAGVDVLRASASTSAASSHFLQPSSRQQETREPDGRYDHILATTKRNKKTAGSTGLYNGGGFEQQHYQQSGQQPQQQQQQRFNKHQCKQWTVKYQELLAFKAKEGHCNVPHGYKQNTGLAMWVKRQRHQYNLMADDKLSTLTGERIRLLESIGFIWSCLDSAWEQHFEELRHFEFCNGHCVVPSTYNENPKLASWAITQRRQCKLLEDGKPSSMTLNRLAALQRIGFPVTTKKKR